MSCARRVTTAVVALGLVGAAAVGLRPKALSVETARVVRGHLEAMLPVDPAPLDARARTEAEGHVRMAEASLRQSQSAVERARNALAFARTDVERIRGLVRSGSVAPHDQLVAEFETRSREAELASAQFAARGAEYELTNARALLNRASRPTTSGDEIVLRSPVRGRVLRVLHPSGGVVTAGTPCLKSATRARWRSWSTCSRPTPRRWRRARRFTSKVQASPKR